MPESNKFLRSLNYSWLLIFFQELEIQGSRDSRIHLLVKKNLKISKRRCSGKEAVSNNKGATFELSRSCSQNLSDPSTFSSISKCYYIFIFLHFWLSDKVYEIRSFSFERKGKIQNILNLHKIKSYPSNSPMIIFSNSSTFGIFNHFHHCTINSFLTFFSLRITQYSNWQIFVF